MRRGSVLLEFVFLVFVLSITTSAYGQVGGTTNKSTMVVPSSEQHETPPSSETTVTIKKAREIAQREALRREEAHRLEALREALGREEAHRIEARREALRANTRDMFAITSTSPYEGNSGRAVIETLEEIKKSAEHYFAQAHSYANAMLALRISAFLFSIAAAVALILNNAEWSRKVALLLSIGAAAVPAADQIFQVSEMHRESWRSAADVSRLFHKCKGDWELSSPKQESDERLASAHILVSACREKLAAFADTELETSSKPLQLPAKIGTK